MDRDEWKAGEAMGESEEATEGLTRDEVLRRALAGSALVAAGGVLSPSALAALAQGPKRGGTLRHGALVASQNWRTLDPHLVFGFAGAERTNSIFEQLVTPRPDCKSYRNVLADEITQEKPDVWLIRIKPGITFHDGKALTADDVIFSIRRMANKKVGGLLWPNLIAVDPNGFRKLDNRTIRMTLKRPDTTIEDVLTSWGAGIVPVGFDPKKPIGTGPFVLQSYTPGRQSRMTRNPNYWISGRPYVDELIIIDLPDDSARANALLSGQVESIDHVPYPFIRTIQGRRGFRILAARRTGWHAQITMRVDVPPFNNNNLRLAMKWVLDREQVLKQALSGHGTIGNDVFGNLDPSYNRSLPQRKQDLDKARFYLRRSGQRNVNVELVAADALTGMVSMAQVLAENASEIGVKINVRKVDTSIAYGPNYLKWKMAQDFWGTKRYLYQCGLQTVPGAFGNGTHWPDARHRARYMSLYRQALRTLNFRKRTQLIHAMQRMDWEFGGNLIPVFYDVVDAHSTKIGAPPAHKGELPMGRANFKDFFFV